MHIIFMMFFVIAVSNQLFCSSQDPKITMLDNGKKYVVGHYTSDGLSCDIPFTETLYKVKIPAYDTKDERFLGNQEILVDAESYKKIQEIFVGNVNEDTKYPQLQKEYDERASENVRTGFALRWVMREHAVERSTSQDKNSGSWFSKYS